MSGGFRNSTSDSPGKRNTRSKYSVASVVSSSVYAPQVAPVISHGPVMLHDHLWHTGGFVNSAADSHRNYSSRVNYTSVISAAALSIVTAPAPFHGAVGLPLSHVYHDGGFHNRSADSPGKYSSRVKYSSIRPSTAPGISFMVPHAPIMAHAHPVRGGYYNPAADSPGKYSSRVKYTSILHGIPPAMYSSHASAAAPWAFTSSAFMAPMYSSSAPAPLHGIPHAMHSSYSSAAAPLASTSSAVVAPNPSTAARAAVSEKKEAAASSQQQIDAVQKQCVTLGVSAVPRKRQCIFVTLCAGTVAPTPASFR
jgi:hypothetical protein